MFSCDVKPRERRSTKNCSDAVLRFRGRREGPAFRGPKYVERFFCDGGNGFFVFVNHPVFLATGQTCFGFSLRQDRKGSNAFILIDSKTNKAF